MADEMLKLSGFSWTFVPGALNCRAIFYIFSQKSNYSLVVLVKQQIAEQKLHYSVTRHNKEFTWTPYRDVYRILNQLENYMATLEESGGKVALKESAEKLTAAMEERDEEKLNKI